MIYTNFRSASMNDVVGGRGPVDFLYLAEGQLLGEHKVRAFNLVTIHPGSEIGYHTHEGESELSYILDGEASIRTENGIQIAGKGDLAFCPSGSAHSIANHGDTPLQIMALVIYD